MVFILVANSEAFLDERVGNNKNCVLGFDMQRSNKVPILLVTANVGSLYEDVSICVQECKFFKFNPS